MKLRQERYGKGSKSRQMIWLCNILFILASTSGLVSTQTIRVGTIVEETIEFFRAKDEPTHDGVQLWANWTNEHGGLALGSTTYQIEVHTIHLYAENNEQALRNATRSLIQEHAVDFLVAPFSTQRMIWALDEIKDLGVAIPYFGTTAATDYIFDDDLYENLWVPHSGTRAIARDAFDLIIALNEDSEDGPQTFGILYSTESPYFLSLASSEQSIVSNSSLAQVALFEGYDGSRTNEDLSLLLADLIPRFKDSDADVFYMVSSFGEDVQVLTNVFQSLDYAPKAALLGGPIDTYDSGFYESAENWLSMATFHPKVTLGVPGFQMGTTQEYLNYYSSTMGMPLGQVYPAIGSAVCLMWQIAARRAGDQWRNITHFNEAIFSIKATDEDAQIFYTSVQFEPHGRNAAQRNLMVQFRDGDIHPILGASDIEYPAPWPWRQTDADGIDTEATVGIIVGAIVGVMILMVMICAIVALILLVVYKWKFYLIFLPKSRELKEVK